MINNSRNRQLVFGRDRQMVNISRQRQMVNSSGWLLAGTYNCLHRQGQTDDFIIRIHPNVCHAVPGEKVLALLEQS
jgi:hypothetical protein